MVAREFSDDAGLRAPRQRQLLGFEFGVGRQIQERRLRRPRLDRSGRHQLRDAEHFDLRRRRLCVDERDRRVGGAEIDADDETGRAHANSTSAGATTNGSVPRAGAGSVTLAMRQPWCLSAPGERRLTDDVADEADARRIEPGIDAHLRVLFFAQHRLERHVLGERLLAAAMDVAHRGADLRVGIAVDVLLQKIEQAPFALQDGQQLHRRAVAVASGDLLADRRGHRLRRVELGYAPDARRRLGLFGRQRAPLERLGGQEQRRVGRQPPREQNQEETLDGEPQSHRADGVVRATVPVKAVRLLW